MYKKLSLTEHNLDIRKNSIFKYCDFIEDLSSVKGLFKNNIITGSFSGLHTVKGIGVTLLYVDKKLHLIMSMSRRFKVGKNLTSRFINSGLFPLTLPDKISQRNPIKIYGTMTVSIDEQQRILVSSNAIREKGLTILLAYLLQGEEPIGEDVKQLRYFAHSTNMVRYYFSKEFDKLMLDAGIQTASSVEEFPLEPFYKNKNMRLFSLPQIQDKAPPRQLLKINGEYFEWRGYLVFVDSIRRWLYYYSPHQTYANHGFIIRYPATCVITRITSIRSFYDTLGTERIVLSVSPVDIDGWLVKKTNVLSGKTFRELGVSVGSKILLTVKSGGAPHIIRPNDKEKYIESVYST